MSNIKNISLSAALHGHQELFIEALSDCIKNATQHLSDEQFSKAFVPEKFSQIKPEKILLAA